MDLYKAIKDLYEQKKRLDQVIESLEELQRTGKAGPPAPEKRRGRRSMDAKARKEVSDRMKRYWAKKRKETGKAGTAVNGRSPGRGARPKPGLQEVPSLHTAPPANASPRSTS